MFSFNTLYTRFPCHILVALIFCAGLSSIYEKVHDFWIGPVEVIVDNSITKRINLNISTYPNQDLVSKLEQSDDLICNKETWELLDEPVKILDVYCPESAEWVRERYHNSKLEFDKGCDTYATYNFLNQKLKINTILLKSENNGRIASVLAHEYQHSRQNYNLGKIMQISISKLFTWNEPPFLEDEAELLEHRVYLAIIKHESIYNQE